MAVDLEPVVEEVQARLPDTARVAVLDHDGVYWKLEEKPVAEVTDGDLVFGPRVLAVLCPSARYVDADCDLPGGRYKWNGTAGRFEPLLREQRKAAPAAPTLEQAFYGFLTQGAEDPRVTAWLDHFRKTMDRVGG